MAESSSEGIVSKTDFKKSPAGLYRRWALEISAAKDNQKKWLDQADKADKRFKGETDKSAADGGSRRSRLHLFHANVNIVLAILYGQMPKVDVSRRFADSDDDEARVSSEILERHLNTDIEDDNDDFPHEVKDALQDWKITGFGICRLRYEAEFEQNPGAAAKLDDEGQEIAPAIEPYDEKGKENICTEYWSWRDFLWSPCRRWKEVRWVAFKSEMTRDEAVKRFGAKLGKAIPLQKRSLKDGNKDDDLKEAWSRSAVWEIWDKDTRTVYWFAEGMDTILDQKPDPLGLKGFFPCPRPLIANATTSKLMPKPDVELDGPLYDEIDEIADRLRKLVKRAQLKGAYNKAFPELARITEEAGEGQMIAVSGWGALSEKGGLASQMDFLPLDMIIKAIEVLTVKLVEKIQLLDQIIGLSAAIRGQANPNSTATANRIEAGFASTRLETDKDEVARFASDIQKLRSEIIANHYDAETIIERSNAMRMELDPMTHEPNVELIMKAVDLIKSDFRQYRVEIKPDSLALRDYASMKQERVETIGALAGLFQQAIPMVQMFPQAAPFVLEVGKWLMSSTKGSQQIEGIFDKFAAQAEQAAMQPKPPAPPDPKLQAAQVKAEAEGTKAKLGVVQSVVDAKTHTAKANMDIQVAQAHHSMEMQRLAAKTQADQAKAAQAITQPTGGQF